MLKKIISLHFHLVQTAAGEVEVGLEEEFLHRSKEIGWGLVKLIRNWLVMGHWKGGGGVSVPGGV